MVGEQVTLLASGPQLERLDDHVAILNVNQKVRRIVEEIALGSAFSPPQVVVMVQDQKLWAANPDWHPRPDSGCPVIAVEGCPAEPDDLEKIHIDRARAAVILADPRQGELADAHSTLVAVAIERRSPQVHTVMELIASVNRVHLRSTEVNEVVCVGELSERLIAQSCISPGIAHVFSALLHAHPGTTQVVVIGLPAELVGMSFRQLCRRAIERRAPFVIAGFIRHREPSEGGETEITAGSGHGLVINPRAGEDPGRDTPLQLGDSLVAIAYQRPDLGLLCGTPG